MTMHNLVEPLRQQTFVTTAAQEQFLRDGYGGATFTRSGVTPLEAFEQAGGDQYRLELLPLVAVDSTGKTVVDAKTVNSLLLYQTAPKPHSIGQVKKATDVLEHRTFIEMMTKIAPNVKVDTILISPSGDQMVIQVPITEIDIFGDEVQNKLVMWSSVKRGTGCGALLWSMPLRCTNQIPVIQMSARKKSNGGFALRGGNYGLSAEKLLERATGFAQTGTERLKFIYGEMAKHQLTARDVELMLNQVYKMPLQPQVEITDTKVSNFEKMQLWSEARHAVKEKHDLVREVLENRNGTGVGFSLYSMVQAVSEVETKHKVGNIATATKQMMNGVRQTRIADAFNLSVEALRRNKVDVFSK